MKLSKIIKKILREQEEIEPIGGETKSPNEFAYFDFKKSTSLDPFNLSMYAGWNSLIVIKLNLDKDQDLTSDFIKIKLSEIYNKEKILVVVKGILKISIKKKHFFLKEFDALNFFSNEYKIKCKENTIAYLVSAVDSSIYKKVKDLTAP